MKTRGMHREFQAPLYLHYTVVELRCIRVQTHTTHGVTMLRLATSTAINPSPGIVGHSSDVNGRIGTFPTGL